MYPLTGYTINEVEKQFIIKLFMNISNFAIYLFEDLNYFECITLKKILTQLRIKYLLYDELK